MPKNYELEKNIMQNVFSTNFTLGPVSITEEYYAVFCVA